MSGSLAWGKGILSQFPNWPICSAVPSSLVSSLVISPHWWASPEEWTGPSNRTEGTMPDLQDAPQQALPHSPCSPVSPALGEPAAASGGCPSSPRVPSKGQGPDISL